MCASERRRWRVSATTLNLRAHWLGVISDWIGTMARQLLSAGYRRGELGCDLLAESSSLLTQGDGGYVRTGAGVHGRSVYRVRTCASLKMTPRSRGRSCTARAVNPRRSPKQRVTSQPRVVRGLVNLRVAHGARCRSTSLIELGHNGCLRDAETCRDVDNTRAIGGSRAPFAGAAAQGPPAHLVVARRFGRVVDKKFRPLH